MSYSMIYKKTFQVLAAAFALLVTTSCERRELYVYGDEFRSTRLNVDWREYAPTDPDGMTSWFYPVNNPEMSKPLRSTTAEVRHHELYLPHGNYRGMLIDYSPEEYSRQTFFDLDDPEQSRVEILPSPYQPESLVELFGEPCYHVALPSVESETNLFTVSDQMEQMALDTLENVFIDGGAYGNYIPYKERDYYQETIKITDLNSVPHSLLWKCRVRVFLKGFNYLWQTQGSLAGLSNGHYLMRHKNTDTPCLISLDDWELQRKGDNEGYIGVTITCFGLRPASIKPDAPKHSPTRAGEVEPDYKYDEWYAYRYDLCSPEELRLNLRFMLRDHATERVYHFDVGKYVVSFDEQQVLRIDLDEEDFENDPSLEPIDLPYVEPYNGTGFDAEVTPWKDEEPVDVPI